MIHFNTLTFNKTHPESVVLKEVVAAENAAIAEAKGRQWFVHVLFGLALLCESNQI